MERKIFLTLILVMFSTLLNAQRLGRFTMSKFAADGKSGIAYPMQKSFFAKLPTDTIPSYARGDTTFYFIYLWLPQPVKELGLQLISPVPEYASANKGDYQVEDYHDSLKKARNYFDPLLIAVRVPNINSPEEIFIKGNNISLRLMGRNDNSPEVVAQPSMMKKNSILRIGVNENDTAYAPAGLYTISFASTDNKKPERTFVLQVGVTEVVPGLKIFRRQDELSESY